MAYVPKIIGKDEKLIGIARLHWIYAAKGIAWFVLLAGCGWLLSGVINRLVLAIGSSTELYTIPVVLMRLSNGASLFLMAGGALIFLLFVMKIIFTEVALSSRRVIHKTGWLFVKVHQIDLEEIRGENLDLGYLGRILGYGYLMLDCRFIGDVRLPAIEQPERFLKALHHARANSQDALAVVLGKGNGAPLQVVPPPTDQQQPELPQPAPPQPEPEIQPGQPGPHPEADPPSAPQEAPARPVPHAPPPQKPQVPPEQPHQQPVQPIPAPPPSQPPLQPPGEAQIIIQNAAIDPKLVQEVVRQVMPQMAQQVAKELAEQGVLESQQDDNDIDTGLANSFDEAALDKDGHPRDHRPSLEQVIH